MTDTSGNVRIETIDWTWARQSLQVEAAWLGAGPIIVLLPALSSVATRHEMAPLQHQLAERFSTVGVDWPGFGTRARPRLAWTPAAYRAWLAHLLADIVPGPLATLAAGHGAGYLLDRVARRPGSAGRVGLLAPTWRGPLPTMAGRHLPLFAALVRLGDWPGVGAALYRANVNRPMAAMMIRGHVYADPATLTEARRAIQEAVMHAPGARHAALRFVTGQLDPFASRAASLATVARVRDPMRLVFGAATPRKSLTEMEAPAQVEGISADRLACGKLAVHEEYAPAVAASFGP